MIFRTSNYFPIYLGIYLLRKLFFSCGVLWIYLTNIRWPSKSMQAICRILTPKTYSSIFLYSKIYKKLKNILLLINLQGRPLLQINLQGLRSLWGPGTLGLVFWIRNRIFKLNKSTYCGASFNFLLLPFLNVS